MTNTEKGQDQEPLSVGRDPLLSPGHTERPRDSTLALGSSIFSKHRGHRAEPFLVPAAEATPSVAPVAQLPTTALGVTGDSP